MSGAGFERELLVLEQSLRRLSAECDAFLYGSATRPPVETRKHIEEMLRRLNASESMSAAERYRFATLQGRFSTLTERWERLLGEKEAGRRPGLYGHFRESGGASGGPSGAFRGPPAPPRPAPTPGGPPPYKRSGLPSRPTRIGTSSSGTLPRRRPAEKT